MICSFSFNASRDPTFRWQIHTKSNQHQVSCKHTSQVLWSDRIPVPSVRFSLPSLVQARISGPTITNRGDVFCRFVLPCLLLVLPRASSVSLVALQYAQRVSSFLPMSRDLPSFPRPSRSRRFILFPKTSGTFSSPSSEKLKQGGRKRSIQLAQEKPKNFLVSNNQQ